jgi:hypothetical protein
VKGLNKKLLVTDGFSEKFYPKKTIPILFKQIQNLETEKKVLQSYFYKVSKTWTQNVKRWHAIKKITDKPHL